jgi:ATP synthase F1 delta subunit
LLYPFSYANQTGLWGIKNYEIMTQTLGHHRTARNYAAALLEEARAFSAVAVTGDCLTALSDMIRQDPNTPYTLNLRYKKPDLASPLVDFFAAKGCTQPAFILRFLTLLAMHNRFSLLPVIADMYQRLYDEEQGIVDIFVISAAPLKEDEETQITDLLKQRWPQPRVMFSVNSQLLGGFQVLVGSCLYDLSLANRLQQLKTKLSGVIARSYEGDLPQ